MKKKKKPYRSLWSNIWWSFRGQLRYSPIAFFLLLLTVPINVGLSWAEVYLPSLVVAQVTEGRSLQQAVTAVGAVLLAMLVGNVGKNMITYLQDGYQGIYRTHVSARIYRKSLECFYQVYEKKEVMDLKERATRATQSWNGGNPLLDFPAQFWKLTESIFCYLLFGSVISFVNPWLLPILTLAPLVNWFCVRAYQKWEYSQRDKWTQIDRKLGYVQNKPSDFAAAKDIRIYGMTGWFSRVFASLSGQRARWDKKLSSRDFLSHAADLVVILLRDGAAYAILIAMALRGELSADEFVLYFSAISSFAAWVGAILTNWQKLHDGSLKLCDLREYLEYPEWEGTGEADPAAHRNAAPEIVFDHVSFRYDGAVTDTIHDLSFCIHAGEKIAIVGLNGAGKTTIVKLLCGLYRPTEGQIYVNGIPSEQFLKKDYYQLFAPVFQDVKAAFFSLAETVSGKKEAETDLERAESCMRQAGLGEKLDTLPKGIHSRLDKQLNKDGIELSGGELQKLMLARALYKDAPMLVLDEPTAALDPIAESKIYQEYQQMTEKKSALFISHRLASTRFCDRILYLKEGRITEEGTHESLIAAGGDYSRLYEMQSSWYREDWKKEGDE